MPTVEITPFLIWYEILGKRGRLTDPTLPDAVRHMEPLKLWYETAGDTGPALFQIHGLGLASRVFEQVVAHLSGSARLVSVDLCGCGKSHRPVQEYSVTQWAEDLATAMRKMGIQKAHVHGTSLGGMVALELALGSPELVESLVLSSTAARLPDSSRNELSELAKLAEAEELLSESAVERLASLFFSKQHMTSQGQKAAAQSLAADLASDNTEHLFARMCQAFGEFDAIGRLGQVSARTLVLSGSDDGLVPTEAVRALAEGIPNSELKILDGAGHYLVIEQPEQVAAAIRSFIGL